MELKLTIEFENAVHHGSGYGAAGIIDRTVLRDSRGMPYLAGSGLKGKFRAAAAQLIRADKGEPCGPPGKQWCKGRTGCALCELFGSPMRQGLAIFRDAYPAEPERQVMREQMRAASAKEEAAARPLQTAGVELRTTTAMSRHWKRAESEHLFITEVVSRVVRFETSIGGDLRPDHVRMLRDGSTLLTHFGGSGARGLGNCVYRIEGAAEAEHP
jgi:CRISPR/Cas system CSM-associated protein Csm3 (group 7 of RAMP superfamily)